MNARWLLRWFVVCVRSAWEHNCESSILGLSGLWPFLLLFYISCFPFHSCPDWWRTRRNGPSTDCPHLLQSTRLSINVAPTIACHCCSRGRAIVIPQYNSNVGCLLHSSHNHSTTSGHCVLSLSRSRQTNPSTIRSTAIITSFALCSCLFNGSMFVLQLSNHVTTITCMGIAAHPLHFTLNSLSWLPLSLSAVNQII